MSIGRLLEDVPYRSPYLAAHIGAMFIFGWLSARLYVDTSANPELVSIAWLLSAAMAVVSLALWAAPLLLWRELARGTGRLGLYAALAAVLACSVGEIARSLWDPVSKVTFEMVQILLTPFTTDLIVRPERMMIGTARFAVVISPQCSGLEGAALLIVFGILWLILFRKDIRFPQALTLLPISVAILFLLNAARIAVLVLIGDAGAR